MSLPSRIVAAAESWLGTPYKPNGKDRGGVDCLNWCACVFVEVGVLSSVPPWRADAAFWQGRGDRICDSIEEARRLLVDGYRLDAVGEPMPGDLITVSHFRALRKATHAAVVEKVVDGCVDVVEAARGFAVVRCSLPASLRVHRIYRVRPA